MVKTRYAAPFSSELAVQRVKEWQRFATHGHQLSGPASASVTIVEFADYQCPACRLLAPVLDSISASAGDSIRIVFRHFPLPTHVFAWQAALLSECASRQGKFAQMHRRLFQAQDSLGAIAWTRLALQAGVADTVAVAECLQSRDAADRVSADTAAAHELAMRATPTLLINGLRVEGAMSPNQLQRLVERGATLR